MYNEYYRSALNETLDRESAYRFRTAVELKAVAPANAPAKRKTVVKPKSG